MALEGNAKDFGLSEIFQLISIQKKSGMLSVSGEDNSVVFFDQGMIISTRDRRNRTKDPLREYLLSYGFLSRDEMNRIQQIQSESNLDLTDILLSEKYFSEDELTVIFTEQIQETIQNILSWPRSYYKFIIGKRVIQGINTFATLKVDSLLMESMRRIDEFPELKKIFPSETTAIRKISPEDDQLPELDKYEEVIYDLLEVHHTVGKLIVKAKMASFCTYEALKNLLEKGLIEVTEVSDAKGEYKSEESGKEQREGKKSFLPAVAIVLILAASFAIGNYMVPTLIPDCSRTYFTNVQSPRDSNLMASNLAVFKSRQIKSTIEAKLEEYKAMKGTYPFTLEILVARKFISGKTIAGAQQLGISYTTGKDGKSYRLKTN
jgi:hypothetical protein